MNWWRGLGLSDEERRRAPTPSPDDEEPFDLMALIPEKQRDECLDWKKAHARPCRIKKLLVETAVVEIERGWTVKVRISWLWGYCACERPSTCKCGAIRRDRALREMERIHRKRMEQGYGLNYGETD